MKKRIVFRREFGVVSALWMDGRVEQIDVDPLPEDPSFTKDTMLGSIHVGRVRNIVKSIQAAFIEVAGGQMCYYSLLQNPLPVFVKSANGKSVCQDDEIIVQITKAGIKTKEPVAESELSINGRYIVIVRGKRGISFSKKIGDELWKEEVQKRLSSHLENDLGVIVRTNAYEIPIVTLEEELCSLNAVYRDIMAKAQYRTGKTLLYAPDPDYLRTLRDTAQEGLDEIVTDDPILYEQIREYWKAYEAESQVRVIRYNEGETKSETTGVSLVQAYSLDRVMREALAERVWLKSGAYLVIQPTEALTVIDVNSGKAIAGKRIAKHSADEAFYKINLEAAREVMHQMRLRNLSGIIVVDFINMKEDRWKDQLMEELKKMAGKDPVRTIVVDMTKLNLVEITRKKVKKPLHEWMGNRGNSVED